MNMPDRAQLDAAVNQFLEQKNKECILCGGSKLHSLGVFIPDKPWEFGGPPIKAGKMRVMVYGLCRACAGRKGFETAVEDKIRTDLGPAGRAEPDAPGRED